MSTGATPLTPPQPAPLSQAARVVNTFFAPSKTFDDIRRSASWWVPWLLISIFSVAFMVTIEKKIGWDQVINTEMARSPSAQARMEQATPEQREQGMAIQRMIFRGIAYGSPVMTLIVLVLISAVLLAAFNFGAGAELKFGQSLAIVSYASLPGLVSAVVGIVSLLAGVNPEGFNMRNPVASNVAYFMDPTQHKFLYGLASAIDVFTIWTILLLAMGFSRNSKVKRGTSLGIVIGIYLVYKVAASAIGSLG